MHSALIPNSLQDAPALIEAVFPAQKVSFEAQRERKAGAGQTLTALRPYWKGRKPLILVRAIVLGSLLPQTENAERDLEIFEKLMAFDDEGLSRRALIQNKLKPKEIAAHITLENPWDFFSHNVKEDDPLAEEVAAWTFPLDCDEEGISIRWRRDLNQADKIAIYRKALNTFLSYEAKAMLCKRPEELDQAWLYEPIWPTVNCHYAHLGIKAHSHQQLIEQLGILRYGHRPKVGDTFCGGGSIPFEAARLGCDVYASDTWQRVKGIERFYLRMMDMETSGASKLDNYQNFAKAFRVEDYTKAMGSMTANKARLKGIQEFTSRDLPDSTEIGATWLGRLTIGLQQLLADTEPQVVVSQLQAELPDFMEIRPVLIDLLQFIQLKSPDEVVRGVAEVLANRLHNLRALGQ